ncbi:MAG: MazG family protein [Candidatus Nanopelagicales bacterium]|jgi:XTP/dITP diphosphohydrolase|nr:MazG family protein [Candidatus Nanopelagicales bacterium]MDP4666514.1 MazG family protein [Candidatus Nanopelagicales bacterium]MDP4896102.1 MazG family protein [Candidatus Nanopelagicales bacterium]MDP5050289.1 MazG family protein [Candidatus Nanopelagicales bacterium]
MTSPVDQLVQVMDQLRSPGGCPWDAEQTHESLARYLLEETYEALEAMDQGDLGSLREELGDLLLQVVFHARIAQERDPEFSLAAIAQGVVDKLIRRHPHVFTDLVVTSSDQLEDNWAKIKETEKQRESVTDGVPIAMPALALATQLIYRSRKIDADAGDPAMKEALRKIIGEVSQDQVAALLVATVELARERDIDAESVLRAEMMGYRARVRQVEGL